MTARGGATLSGSRSGDTRQYILSYKVAIREGVKRKSITRCSAGTMGRGKNVGEIGDAADADGISWADAFAEAVPRGKAYEAIQEVT